MKNKNIQNSDIIKGYKGIMDLDVSMYNESEREIVIQQHYKDIEDYKIYQKELKPHLRYENTIERINRIFENDRFAIHKRNKEEERKKQQKLEEMRNYLARLPK
jgi:hypothetical protein